MFSLFKRQPAEVTFKQKVESFWEWYRSVAEKFVRDFERKELPKQAALVSERVDELGGGLAWVFGPGEKEGEHSFTLSAEGDAHRQFLTQYWLARAPLVRGWIFYASRQPGKLTDNEIEIGTEKFTAKELWITPQLNQENEKIELTAWNPNWAKIGERERWTVLFLFLDEALGEYGTQQWLGKMELSDTQLKEAFPLSELPEYVKKIERETGWKKFRPGESAVLYQFKEPHDRFPRGDIIVGTTMHQRLLEDYSEAEGNLENPLNDSGADYVYVAFPSKILPKGEESETRGKIEDALDLILRSQASGRLLGGAYGTRNAYVDLLVFDGRRSFELIRNELKKLGLPAGTSLNYFCREKTSRVFEL
jgi:hypothetical protein